VHQFVNLVSELLDGQSILFVPIICCQQASFKRRFDFLAVELGLFFGYLEFVLGSFLSLSKLKRNFISG